MTAGVVILLLLARQPACSSPTSGCGDASLASRSWSQGGSFWIGPAHMRGGYLLAPHRACGVGTARQGPCRARGPCLSSCLCRLTLWRRRAVPFQSRGCIARFIETGSSPASARSSREGGKRVDAHELGGNRSTSMAASGGLPKRGHPCRRRRLGDRHDVARAVGRRRRAHPRRRGWRRRRATHGPGGNDRRSTRRVRRSAHGPTAARP